MERPRARTIVKSTRFTHKDGVSSSGIKLHESHTNSDEIDVPELVHDFLRLAFESFELSSHHTRRLIVSPQLLRHATTNPNTDAALREARAILQINEDVRAKLQDEADFEDEIVVVFFSPANPKNYLAFGLKRLYWYNASTRDPARLDDSDDGPSDDEEIEAPRLRVSSSTPAAHGRDETSSLGGQLVALPYHERYVIEQQDVEELRHKAEPAAVAAAAAAQGARGGARSVKSMSDVDFTLNRQGVVLAVPRNGNVLEVQELPIRFTADRGNVEGSRLCVLLNALRELLEGPANDSITTVAPDWNTLSHVQIRRETVPSHLAEAKRNRLNGMLLDDDGEQVSLDTPLDAPEGSALKFRLGAGITSYLKTLEIGALGFAAAALAALPTLALNSSGGVLSAIGHTGISEVYSLGNRAPWTVTFWPTQGLDLLYTCVLMYTFAAMKRSASRVMHDVDTGSIDPSDFTIYCTGVPAELGATKETEAAAIASYRRFFDGVLRNSPGRDAHAVGTPAVPSDCEISEIVLLRNNSTWLQLRRYLSEAVAAKRIAELKEQKPRAWRPKLCGVTVGEAEQRCFGSLSGYSSRYWQEQIDRTTQQLKEIEEQSASMDLAPEIVGAFITFNSTQAVEKVRSELAPQSVFHLRSLIPFGNARPFPYDLEAGAQTHPPGAPQANLAGAAVAVAHVADRVRKSISANVMPTLRTARMSIAGWATLQDEESNDGRPVHSAAQPMTKEQRLAHAGSPSGGGMSREGTITVEAAEEPTDYIWENLNIQGWSRLSLECAGWVGCILTVLCAIALNVQLSLHFDSTPMSPGIFTMTDQKCADVNYLRTVPHAARHCGLGYGTMSLTDSLVKSMLDGPVAGSASLQPTSLGGGHLGELVAATRCTAHIDGGAFTSYADWRALTSPSANFPVSDRYGKFHPKCAFLTNPTDDGLGGFYVADAAGTEHTMYCGFRANTSVLPYRMSASFKCEAPLFRPDHPGGVSNEAGIADVIVPSQCDEPNCLLCHAHYAACLQDSRAVQRGTTEMIRAALGVSDSDLQAYGVGAVIGAINVILPGIAEQLTSIQRPISRTAQQRTLMLMTFVMLAGHSLGSLFVVNKHAIGRLGFYTVAGNQVYALLTTYSAYRLIMLWTAPHVAYFYKTRIAYRKTKTQMELNQLFEGEEFAYATNMAATLFLVFMAVLFSTPFPLALIVAAVALGLRYVTERLYFVRVYAKPPNYNGRLIESMLAALPYALLGKIGSMRSFYAETQAGNIGVLVVGFVFYCWCFLRLPDSWSSSPFLSALVWQNPLADEKCHDSDLGSTVTHQEVLARGKVCRYDPLMSTDAASCISTEHLRCIERAAKKYGAIDAAAIIQQPKPGAAVASQADSRGDGEDGPQLLLYVSPQTINTIALKSELRDSTFIALHMVPAHIISMDKIPRIGAKGKYVDVKALPSPHIDSEVRSPHYNDGHAVPLMPFRWENDAKLPLVRLCPNSFEKAHPSKDSAHHPHASEGGGSCTWSRMHRLSGATSFKTFASWVEARAWIEANLRSPRCDAQGLPRQLGPCADSTEPAPVAEGTTRAAMPPEPRYTYVGMPTQLVAPVRSWAMLDEAGFQPGSKQQPWVVCYTKDRTEFPSLKWRLLEADSREKLQRQIDELLDTSGYEEGESQDVWVVQTVAAELRTQDEQASDDAQQRTAQREPQRKIAAHRSEAVAKPKLVSGKSTRLRKADVGRVDGNRSSGSIGGGLSGACVRWVAVLRAGGVPPQIDGVRTNAETGVEFVLEETLQAAMSRRLTSGFELMCTAGTPPTANPRLLAFTRLRSNWATHVTWTTPDWPKEWVASQQADGYLIVSVAYCAESWTVTMAHGTSGDGVADEVHGISKDMFPRQAVLFEPCWPPQDGNVDVFLAAGYTISSLACGPHIRELTPPLESTAEPALPNSTYVAVLTKCPNSMLPLCHRSRGSLEYELRMSHLLGKRCWHVDWTKDAHCRVHASSTDEVSTNERSCLRCVAMGGVGETPPIIPRAAFVLDGDEGTFWRSAEILGHVPAPEALTIDLGSIRAVDRILLFWGAEEGERPEPMARDAELLLSCDCEQLPSFDEDTVRMEPGMAAVVYRLSENSERIPIGSLHDRDQRHFDEPPEGYAEGYSMNTVAFAEPRHVRYVQIHLKIPAAGMGFYALRNVMVLGPSPHSADACRAADELLARIQSPRPYAPGHSPTAGPSYHRSSIPDKRVSATIPPAATSAAAAPAVHVAAGATAAPVEAAKNVARAAAPGPSLHLPVPPPTTTPCISSLSRAADLPVSRAADPSGHGANGNGASASCSDGAYGNSDTMITSGHGVDGMFAINKMREINRQKSPRQSPFASPHGSPRGSPRESPRRPERD